MPNILICPNIISLEPGPRRFCAYAEIKRFWSGGPTPTLNLARENELVILLRILPYWEANMKSTRNEHYEIECFRNMTGSVFSFLAVNFGRESQFYGTRGPRNVTRRAH